MAKKIVIKALCCTNDNYNSY